MSKGSPMVSIRFTKPILARIQKERKLIKCKDLSDTIRHLIGVGLGVYDTKTDKVYYTLSDKQKKGLETGRGAIVMDKSSNTILVRVSDTSKFKLEDIYQKILDNLNQ